ncbi:MAG: transcription termination factor NusA [Anaerolineae bacterium]|nr:transcription termination factor NusA [Anaerolineae bacterium]
MRSDFMLAINQLCAERKLSPDVVLEAVEASLISAYKRNFGAAANIEVHIEQDTGDVRVFAAKEVVETVTDRKEEISLRDAQRVEPDAKLGDMVLIESTPRDFGRIAAQTAKQVILQRIREAEREALYSSFADSAGEIAHGTIQSKDFHSGDVVVNIEGAEAVLPSREQVPSEHYHRGRRLRAYVVDVRRGSRGPQITLSRRSPALLRRLMELEVPEIFSGAVEIKAIAREAGSRSKVAVQATQEGVDPVGSCVGVRGGRIQNVVNELNGEKIDVVQWDSEMATFIANSLSPAKVMNVLLSDGPDTGKTATVIVPDRQLSLAIGKEGQNARLAAKLTGWRIDIKSATEAAEETLGRLEITDLAPDEMDLLSLAEALLHKQDEDGFSEEERGVIQQVMAMAHEEPWPEPEAQKAEAEGEPEAEVEEEAAEAVAAEPSEEVEEELEAAEAGPIPAEAEAEPSEPEKVPAGVEARDLRDVELDEAAPPFEGEPVSDSIGWVQTETQEDLYTGWSDEEEVETVEFEWVADETEEEGAEEYRPEKKKKGKKRRRREPEFEQVESEQGWRRGRGPRGRGR